MADTMFLPESEKVDKEHSNHSNDSSTSNPPRAPAQPILSEGPLPAEGQNVYQTPSHVRQSSANLQRAQSAVSSLRSRRPIGPFSHPLTHQQTEPSVIVDFDGPDDPYNPMNWAFRKKVLTTTLYGVTTMIATWASSIYSPGVTQISEEFHVGTEVSIIGISLLLFGFGVGPLLWAPLSEVYGRKPAVLLPYFLSAVFLFGTATAKDIQTIMITRFFAGFFGSAPVTNTGGVLGDIWTADTRGIAIVGYALAVGGGPTLGPIVGGAIVQSYLGWRWTEYLTGIMMLAMLFFDVLLLDETYPATLLVNKARRLRHESGNWALHAKHEEWDVSIAEMVKKYMIRPFQLLFTPICFLVVLYASFVYGILYTSLGAIPVEFQDERGWNVLVGALPFLGLLLGMLIGGAENLYNQKYYVKRFIAAGNRAVPEARLPPMMSGSIIFAVGLFIFGWTSDRNIFWIAPCIGAVCIGLGFFTIFQSCLNYLIDTFQRYAASAVGANTFMRSMLAGAFPLFITPMLHNMGISWGMSVFGFIAVAMIPIPFLFFVYGKRIRAKGCWSRESVLWY